MSFLDVTKFLSGKGASLSSRITNTSALADNVLSVFGTSATGVLSRINGSAKISTQGDSYVAEKSASLFGKIGSTAASSVQKLTGKDNPPEGGQEEYNEEIVVTAPVKYPLDLGEFYTRLEFMDYKRPSPTKEPEITHALSIFLPLPSQLIDAYNVSYDTPELGLIGSIADSLVQAADGDADSSTASGAGLAAGTRAAQVAGATTAGSVAGKVAPGLGRLASLAVGASISGEAMTAASQFTGAILNPNISVAFRGPQLRHFTLEWEFAPHNAKESSELKKIIKLIRQRMLPSMTYEKSRSILSYPQMCKVSLKPDVIPYKRAMVTNVGINYAANGIPSFFEGTNEPVFISMSISFTELEYFLSEDFGGDTAKGLNTDFLDVGKKLLGKMKEASSEGLSDLAEFATGTSSNPQGG